MEQITVLINTIMKATCHGLTLSVIFFPQCCVNKKKICPNQEKKKSISKRYKLPVKK